MTVRRIVTEDVNGKSRVAADGPAPSTWCDEIWATTPDHPLGRASTAPARELSARPGGTFFRMVQLPPDAVVRASTTGRAVEGVDPQGVDREGFHRTPTLDYVYVLDGPVELVLDDTSVVVEPGDCVVQRGTNHAWRNHGTEPIRLLAVMIGV
jgi:mannose-6-phosphate isomerase-like protein (cupin superfamily)